MEGLTILRTALKANGFFSLVTAILTLILGSTVVAINEMANGQPMTFSIQLIVFAAVVLIAAYRKKTPTILVWVIIVLDVLYVLFGFYNLSIVAPELSVGGELLIVVTNLLVALFAIFQTIGIIKYRKSLRAIN
ncbi:hypothetical protein GTQ34_09675 [Muricauda sp. JGD-17]|uniref:Uncharacterized protein n=1 Tax=Flagellimonas ochracea TaxID=2696472 RepID=A0A964TC74_9FLAO|nr:hypothetical protein [Allomuricauda ochracea]NAY92188.1 hypothetical protein [Allomuricauda ochracea]